MSGGQNGRPTCGRRRRTQSGTSREREERLVALGGGRPPPLSLSQAPLPPPCMLLQVVDPDVLRLIPPPGNPQRGSRNAAGGNDAEDEGEYKHENGGGDDSDLDENDNIPLTSSRFVRGRRPGNKSWIQKISLHDLQREGEFALGRLINNIIPKVPGGRKIRALYGALGTDQQHQQLCGS